MTSAASVVEDWAGWLYFDPGDMPVRVNLKAAEEGGLAGRLRLPSEDLPVLAFDRVTVDEGKLEISFTSLSGEAVRIVGRPADGAMAVV